MTLTPKKPNSATLNALIKRQLAKATADTAGQYDQLSETVDMLSQNVEKLTEDVGQFAHGRDAVKEYIDSLTDDNKAGRKSRFWLSVLSIGMIFASLSAFGAILFDEKQRAAFSAIGDRNVQIAVIVSLFGMSFGLMALLVKGAFQRAKSAETPDILPDHIKMFLDAVKPK